MPSVRDSSTSPAKGAVRKKVPVPSRGDGEVEGVRISHPDRILWPKVGVTKLLLAQYYARAADRILPFLKD